MGLMFLKCLSGSSFSLSAHTHACTQTGTRTHPEFGKITILTRTSRSRKQSGRRKKKEPDFASEYELPVGVCSARFGVISSPNNNRESERQKLGHNLAQWPKRDKNTNARFVCGRESEAGEDCTQSPSNPLRRWGPSCAER